MLSKNAAGLDALRPKSGTPSVGQKVSGCVRTSLLAVICIAVASPAFARSRFDGDWSVVVVTRGGACDPSIRYGVTISDGNVLNSGGAPADVRGRVSPGGAVRVNVQSGNQWATGSGRLGRNSGGGVWHGQGSAGVCEGTWVAQRRPYAVEAEGPGRPIYNYAPGLIGPGYQAVRPLAGGYCPPGMHIFYDGYQYLCR